MLDTNNPEGGDEGDLVLAQLVLIHEGDTSVIEVYQSAVSVFLHIVSFLDPNGVVLVVVFSQFVIMSTHYKQ